MDATPDIQAIEDTIRKIPKLIIADDFEIAIESSQGQSRKYVDGNCTEKQFQQEHWISLRIAHRNRPGAAYTTDSSKAGLVHLVDSAFWSADTSSVNPWVRFPVWRPIANDAPFEIPWNLPSVADHFPIDQAMLTELHLELRLENQVSRKSEKTVLRNRRQAFLSEMSFSWRDASPGLEFFERRSASRPLSGPELCRPDFLTLVERPSVGHALPLGDGDAILMRPSVVSTVLSSVLGWYTAPECQRAISPLWQADPSSPLLSTEFDLIDDGFFEGSAHCTPFDLEGSSAQQTVLISDGIMKTSLADYAHAVRENRASTGNLRRTRGVMTPTISPSTLVLKQREGKEKSHEVTLPSRGWVLDSVHDIRAIPVRRNLRKLRCSGWNVEDGMLGDRFIGEEFVLDVARWHREIHDVGTDVVLFDGVSAPSVVFAAPVMSRLEGVLL